jgi:hypothetical protein
LERLQGSWLLPFLLAFSDERICDYQAITIGALAVSPRRQQRFQALTR